MNDGIGTDTAATLALLADTRRSGNMGYGGGEGGGYGGPFSSMTSNAVRINRNNELNRSYNRCTEEKIGANLDRISAQNLEGRINALGTSIKDGQFQAELRSCEKLSAIEREMTANARAAAACCCDTKVQIADTKASLLLQSCNDKGEILAAIASSDSRAIERDRNDLSNELTALKTQVACNCHCPTS